MAPRFAATLATALDGKPAPRTSSSAGPIAFGIAAGALAVGGAALLISVAADAGELKRTPPPSLERIALIARDAPTNRAVGIGLVVGAGAAAAVTVIWALLAPPTTVSVGFAPVHEGGVLTLSSSF